METFFSIFFGIFFIIVVFVIIEAIKRNAKASRGTSRYYDRKNRGITRDNDNDIPSCGSCGG